MLFTEILLSIVVKSYKFFVIISQPVFKAPRFQQTFSFPWRKKKYLDICYKHRVYILI